MPNRQLYDRIERLTKQTLLQLHELEQISEELQKVIEENHNLTMENRHLKDRLDELEPNTHTKKVAKKKKRSQSIINLENIYDQGFQYFATCTMENVEKTMKVVCFVRKSCIAKINA